MAASMRTALPSSEDIEAPYLALAEELSQEDIKAWHQALAEELSQKEIEAWHQALAVEDCVRIRKLLDEHPKLLERWNGGSDVEEKTERKGRTALHVGARRGCVELVQQVLYVQQVLDVHERGRKFQEDEMVRKELSNDEEQTSIMISRGNKQIAADSQFPNGARLPSAEVKSFHELLVAKDAKYDLDALAMAVLNGNIDLIKILQKASRDCGSNPYGKSDEAKGIAVLIQAPENSVIHKPTAAKVTAHDSDMRKKLAKMTEDVMTRHRGIYFRKFFEDPYQNHGDFNFLLPSDYLFHFTFLDFEKLRARDSATPFSESHKKFCGWFLAAMRQDLWRTISDIKEPPGIYSAKRLRTWLLKRQDGQGRTALHVAVDEGTVETFLNLIKGDKDLDWVINHPDGAGRPPLYRAVALGQIASVRSLIADPRTDLNAKFRPMMSMKIPNLSERNGFKSLGRFGTNCKEEGPTALHSAIILRRKEVLECLLKDELNSDDEKQNRPIDDEPKSGEKRNRSRLDLRVSFQCDVQLRNAKLAVDFHPLQLAVLVGDPSILQLLFKDGRTCDRGRHSKPFNLLQWGPQLPKSEIDQCSKCVDRKIDCACKWPAIHLAAASGKYELLTLFLGSKDYDPLAEDCYQNSALHHVMNGREFEFQTHLLDFVSCQHILDSKVLERELINGKKAEDIDVTREGCVSLLLQAGCDIFKENKDKETPHPSKEMSAQFMSWCYNRQAKEFGLLHNALDNAARAISVTATLVAAASYAGPLQPPLGYSRERPGQLQVEILLVRVFIVCDTMSFYLAIAAIMFSLVPFLAMPQQPMAIELRRDRIMVRVAVGLLFPSILFVLCAFGASSIVTIPSDGPFNHARGLTITTVCFGGFICLLSAIFFFVRLLGFSSRRYKWVKVTYNAIFKNLDK